MEITKIKKLNNGDYEITIFNEGREVTYQITEDVLIEHGWYSNQKLTSESLEQLKSAADYSKLYRKTLRYLTIKMRTVQEVKDYLDEQQCPQMMQAEIIEKFKRLKYLNDETYTESFIKQQLTIHKKGPHWIEAQLLKRGIEREQIHKALAKISIPQQKAIMEQVIAGMERLNKTKTTVKLKESILRNLVSRGFAYELALEVISSYHFNKTYDEDALIEPELIKAKRRYGKKYQGYELKKRVIQVLLQKGFAYDLIISKYDEE